MYKLISDLEKGIHAFFGGPEDPGLDLAALEPGMRAAVEHFAEHTLGVSTPITQATGAVAADLISAAAEAIDAGHTATEAYEAGQPPVNAIPAPSVPANAAEQPGQDTAPLPSDASASSGLPAATPTPSAQQAADAGEPERQTPVTTPQTGYVVCPRCQGWRDIASGDKVILCPSCEGNGEVPATADTPAA